MRMISAVLQYNFIWQKNLPRDATLARYLLRALCACLSQVGVLLKRINVGSSWFYFADAKDLREIPLRSPPAGPPNTDGVG